MLTRVGEKKGRREEVANAKNWTGDNCCGKREKNVYVIWRNLE